jgi:hypothetical protein
MGELMHMPLGKPTAVGRAAVRVNDYQALQAHRRRERARKAAEREEFRRKADTRRGGACPPGCRDGRVSKGRARLEAAARAELPEFPKAPKPLGEMSPSEREEFRRELREFQRELKRPQREADLRAERVRPKNRTEMEIFAKDILGEREQPDE